MEAQTIDPKQYPILSEHYGEDATPQHTVTKSQINWLPKETEWDLHPVLGIIVKG